MYFTAEDIYNKLIKDGINTREGTTSLDFMGISVSIRDKSATGNLLQEWLGNWLTHHNIEYRVKDNTQEFPDFLLDETKDNTGLLEIKTFDYDRSPNFDVANFDAYRRSLLSSAYRLDADYLIFAYQLDSEGILTIPRIWLKKIWQITGASGRYPLKCQVKQNMIYNIRPIVWYSNKVTYSPFTSRHNFVTALHKTIAMYATKEEADIWLEDVILKYAEQVGHPL